MTQQGRGKNQLKIGTKRSVTLRLDTFDYKCIQLLAHNANVTISHEIALIIKAVTAQTKAVFTEAQLNQCLKELGIYED